MASRPAWFYEDGIVKRRDFPFVWNPGLAPSQKKKNVAALHKSINDSALEVSTKSDDEFGQSLSPFNLTLDGLPMESVYHATKKYENAGPFLDLKDIKPLNAKRDKRHDNSGELIGFEYKGKTYPRFPKTFFYNYLYYLAVQESILAQDLEKLNDYKYFTDIEFNPNKGTSNQARAIAIVKAIYNEFGELPELSSEDFLKFQNKVLADGIISPT